VGTPAEARSPTDPAVVRAAAGLLGGLVGGEALTGTHDELAGLIGADADVLTVALGELWAIGWVAVRTHGDRAVTVRLERRDPGRHDSVEVDRRRADEPLPPFRRGHPLTRRESDVAALVAEGFTDDEIAARLGIAAGTVGNHLLRIFRRLGLRNRAQVAAWAAKQGLA
jgi:DNA-binding CsgD family transcriptional regulator